MSEERPERAPVEVAVGILIRKDGAILMGSRPEGKPYAGWWEFPGGKLEPGESAEEALRRELSEELDLRIGPSSPWISELLDYPHARVRLHFRRCWSWEGEPRAMERQSFGFYRRGSLPSGKLLPMDDRIAAWAGLPAVAAVIRAGAGVGERIRSAAEEGAGLFWVEGDDELPEVPSGSRIGRNGIFPGVSPDMPPLKGAMAGSLAEIREAAASGSDFAILRAEAEALEAEPPIPAYVPARSAGELHKAVARGAHGVWLLR
ncbi:MAG: NUDIX domain-containing protein [Sutterellaceae bacterium]|nr:NUDIX domain-containing protein [Sutterellaceae bacterium]MDD7441147.1 NUDIX domain-containing protein [Sutterellaceae bacterium]MDY2868218.1 NUDIX domain-containing protein [Mesosutterella sp.]